MQSSTYACNQRLQGTTLHTTFEAALVKRHMWFEVGQIQQHLCSERQAQQDCRLYLAEEGCAEGILNCACCVNVCVCHHSG
jgi:hypothetical protein